MIYDDEPYSSEEDRSSAPDLGNAAYHGMNTANKLSNRQKHPDSSPQNSNASKKETPQSAYQANSANNSSLVPPQKTNSSASTGKDFSAGNSSHGISREKSVSQAGVDTFKNAAKQGAAKGLKTTGEIAAGAATGGAATVIMKVADVAAAGIKKAAEAITYHSETQSSHGLLVLLLILCMIPLLFLFPIFSIFMPASSSSYFFGQFTATKEGNIESKQESGWFAGLEETLAAKFSFFDEPYEAYDGSYKKAFAANKKIIDKALQKAYQETALAELEQIIAESGYDYEKTLESFYHNEVPSDINYAEFMTVMCQSEKFSHLQFDSKRLKNFLTDTNHIKFLYNMSVSPIVETDAETGLEITYGQVDLYKYSLTQLYQMFQIDPNHKNTEIYTCTNYELLGYQENLIRFYADGIDLGPNIRSEEGSIIHKNETTGRDDEDTTIDEINNQISEKYVKLDVPYYNQGDYPSIKYGQGSIQSSGCCLVSLLMIGEYYTGRKLSIADYASPGKGYVTYDKGMGGYYINKYNMLNDLGISFVSQNPYSQRNIMNTLQQGTPVMIHFPKGSEYTSSGHYAIICGYDISTGVFLMCDPGSRSRTKTGISFAKMALNADSYYLYQ